MNNNFDYAKASSDLIDELGGTVKVSEIFNVTTGGVSQWRSGIPDARLMYIRVAYPKEYKKHFSNMPVSKKAA